MQKPAFYHDFARCFLPASWLVLRVFLHFLGQKKTAISLLLLACLLRAWTCLGDAGDAGGAGSASTRDAGDAGDAGDADAWASCFVRGACVEVLLD